MGDKISSGFVLRHAPIINEDTDQHLTLASGKEVVGFVAPAVPQKPLIGIQLGVGHAAVLVALADSRSDLGTLPVAEWSAQGVPDSILISKPFVSAQIVTAVATLLHVPPSGGPA